MTFDPELLYAGALPHDLGLTARFADSGRPCGPSPTGWRPARTTFGTVNADVLSHYLPGFERTDFVEVILASWWAD